MYIWSSQNREKTECRGYRARYLGELKTGDSQYVSFENNCRGISNIFSLLLPLLRTLHVWVLEAYSVSNYSIENIAVSYLKGPSLLLVLLIFRFRTIFNYFTCIIFDFPADEYRH